MSTDPDAELNDEDDEPAEKAQGYDEPAAIDRLGRRPLARAIADVVANTPPEFGVRVGIFGEWGSGKTSVLNFVGQLLLERQHSVVRFSPWGISEPSELWVKFGQELIGQLGKERGTSLSRAKFQYSTAIAKGLQAGKGFASLVPYVGKTLDALAGPALDWVGKLLRETQHQLAGLANPGERIVVMIDDVDRTDPSLVPPILFALREMFDVARFSWILAIDPVIVRAALAQHHPGFALGRDYLEKVVDYRFTLRAPDAATRAALLGRELQESTVITDQRTVREIGEMLPGNPRELRSLARHLLSIEPTTSRFGPEDGLDQRLLLALAVIHSAAPGLLLKLLESQDLLQEITLLSLSSHKDDKHQDAAKKAIGSLLADSEIRQQDRPRLEALLLHVGEGGVWPVETVVNTGSLLDTSPVMTGREAREGMVAADDASALDGWLERFAAREDRPKGEVRRAFFDQLLASHSRAMDVGIWSKPEEGVQRAIPTVVKVVRVIEMLLFDLRAVSEFGPEELEKLRTAFSQWAHFIMPEDYLPAREAEKGALLRFAEDSGLDPLAALSQLTPPWHLEDEAVASKGDEARRRLNRELFEVLERRATESVTNQLDKPDLVATFDGRHQAKDFLLRREGLIWSAGFWPKLNEALHRDKSVARSENSMALLRAVVRRFPGGRTPVVPDANMVKVLWDVGTSVAPNMRMYESIERMRTEAEKAIGETLADPPWWAAKREQYQVATGKPPAAT